MSRIQKYLKDVHWLSRMYLNTIPSQSGSGFRSPSLLIVLRRPMFNLRFSSGMEERHGPPAPVRNKVVAGKRGLNVPADEAGPLG